MVHKLVLFDMHRREVNSLYLIILSEPVKKACSVPHSLLRVCETKIRLCSQVAYILRGEMIFNEKYISNIIHKILLFSSNSSGKMFKVRVIICKEILSPLLSITDSRIRMSSILMPHHAEGFW